jgi:signal transduction histidine kinase/CheY-like chemotaxis protein
VKSPVAIHVAYERTETLERLRALSPRAGFVIAGSDHHGSVMMPPSPAPVLLLEDLSGTDALFVRVQAAASHDPELLVVPLVRSPRRDTDAMLFDAGAFDVIDDGPDMEAQLLRMASLAQRFARLRQEHARLREVLAHQDRLSAVGLLAAGVGHEVNNPNAAILANLEVIRNQLENVLSHPRFQQVDLLHDISSDLLEALGDSIGASRRITAIVHSLNIFSRKAEDGVARPLNINDEVNTVLRLVGKELRFQAHTELDLATSMPPIVAQPHAMTQVVTNLVVNALQALESKRREERCLTIRTRFDDDSVMLEVADNGPGVAPENIGRIFDPFFTTKATGAGTGLGLAITRELVQKNGGEIFVDSELGRGATFRLVFERIPEVAVTKRPVSRMPPANERLRVLIVDDDEMLLRSIVRTLANQFECIPRSSAARALQFLREDDRIDVVLTDIVMPVTNGLELYRQLESEFPALAARTIFLSGGIRSEELRATIADTGRPTTAKPFEIAELMRLIRAIERGVAA